MAERQGCPPEPLSAILDSAHDIGIIGDVTGAGRAEAQGRLDRECLAIACEAANQGIWTWDAATGEGFFNDTYYTMLGYAPGEFPPSHASFIALMHPDDRAPYLAAVQAAIDAGRRTCRHELRLRAKDGGWRWIRTYARALEWDAGGRPTRLVGSHLDITGERLREQAVAAGKALLHGVIDNAEPFVYACDLGHRFVLANRAIAEFFGSTPEAMVGRRRQEFMPADIAAVHDVNECQVVAQERPIQFEEPAPAADGIRYFLTTKFPIRDEQGAITGVGGISTDVTRRRSIEASLQRSELRFRSLFENQLVGMATTSLEKGWIDVNQALCEILGYPRRELLAKTWSELTHPDDLGADLAHFERLLADASDDYEMDKRFIRKDGTVVPAYIAVRAIRRPDRSIEYFVALVQDISARKQAEEALRNSREVLQRFLDHLPGTAYVKDEELRLLVANRSFATLLGREPAAMLGRSNVELFPGAAGARIEADDRRILASGKTEVMLEEFAGGVFETTKFVIPQDSGSALLGGITLDISLRHRLEERIRALLEINELGGTMPEKAFLDLGLQRAESLTGSSIGFLHFVNDDQESIELVSWTPGALAGCTAVFDSHYPISAAGIWADCFRERRPVVFNDYPACTSKRGLPAGHAPLQRLISVPVVEEGMVRMMIGVGNKAGDYGDVDVTTVQLIGNDLWRIVRRARVEADLARRLAEVTALKRRLEQVHLQLLQSEKMSAIGQLAAGIAHELNNPIGFVHSNLGTLGQYLDDLLAVDAAYRQAEAGGGPAASALLAPVRELKAGCDFDYIVADLPKLIAESKEGIERVRRIVLDLKDFSRVGESEWAWCDLHRGLDSTINIVWNELKHKAEVERHYGELPNVNCLPSQINQVFMNLLVNAAQAIETRGRIVLRSGFEPDLQAVWVEFEDSGHGMTPAILKRLFEPFFTTKPVGKGTGLGLSISYAIVERHHGRIEVRSEPGRGSCFRVVLPVDGSRDPAAAAGTGPA